MWIVAVSWPEGRSQEEQAFKQKEAEAREEAEEEEGEEQLEVDEKKNKPVVCQRLLQRVLQSPLLMHRQRYRLQNVPLTPSFLGLLSRR